MYTWVYIHIHVYIYTHIYVYIGIYTYMYIYVYTHIYTEWPKKCMHALLINIFGINVNEISISG